MAKKENSLQQTKGFFKLAGIVSGVKRTDFYTEKMTKTDNPKLRKSVKFAIQTSPENKVFVTLGAQPRDKVYFSKRAEVKGEKATIKPVDWDKRNSFKEDGFKIIGTNIGLVKKLDSDGKEVNDIQHLVEYDAITYIKENLQDDMHVFVRGHVEYSRFEDRNIKQFVIDQISLCQPIDFAAEDFKEIANFEQPIAFRSIEKDTSEENKFIVTGSIVNYNEIVETDFVLRNAKLAQTIKKNLKPYNSIKIFGNLIGYVQEVTVDDDEDDGWGEPNPMEATGNYYKEMLIVGADKASLDTEIYSEEIFDEFMRSKKEFGETAATSTDDEDDDWSV